MPGQDNHGGAKCHSFRAASEVTEQLHRRWRHRIAGEVVFQREDRVEPKRLYQIAQLKMFFVHSNVRSTRLSKDTERHADFHRFLQRLRHECVRIARVREAEARTHSHTSANRMTSPWPTTAWSGSSPHAVAATSAAMTARLAIRR